LDANQRQPNLRRRRKRQERGQRKNHEQCRDICGFPRREAGGRVNKATASGGTFLHAHKR